LDIIGGAYEYLIKHFAATAGKTAGEFYTPPEVSDLMARLADPQAGDDICDPTCGSASFLMKCGRHVRNNTGTKQYALFGQESIGSTWELSTDRGLLPSHNMSGSIFTKKDRQSSHQQADL
jgi:type I restriction enzyme M protein